LEKQDRRVWQKTVGTVADPTSDYLQFTAPLRNSHLKTRNP
jgi:hypothetical protein